MLTRLECKKFKGQDCSMLLNDNIGYFCLNVQHCPRPNKLHFIHPTQYNVIYIKCRITVAWCITSRQMHKKVVTQCCYRQPIRSQHTAHPWSSQTYELKNKFFRLFNVKKEEEKNYSTWVQYTQDPNITSYLFREVFLFSRI